MKRYKTDRNFKIQLPQIIIDNNNSSKNIHFVSEEDKKVKNIMLSKYTTYITDYKKTLKYPSSNYYSTDKLKNYISFDYLNNINLNRKTDFLSTFNEFNLNKQTGIFKTNINNNNKFFNNNINIQLLSHSNFDSQDLIFFTPKYHIQKSDEDILKYFVEGIFLRKPEYLKYIGINEKNIHPHILNQNDFEFYTNYLENISKNLNLTEKKTKNYETGDIIKNRKLNFILDLKSICLQFEEVNINDEEKLVEIKNSENEIFESNDEINEINEFIKNRHNLYLPFKYLPMIYLLNYSNFKSFISEILSFDSQTNQFKFVGEKELEEITKKYSGNCQNKLFNYKNENKIEVFKNCFFYENEYYYNNQYFWFIHTSDKIKVFKLKILLPLITFRMDEFMIRFQKYANKWLILELVKENFKSWDRYSLFNLFMNKKLRNLVSDILNKKINYLNISKLQFFGPVINGNIYQKNNFEFFITDLITNNINHYYFVIPYRVLIMKRGHEKIDLNDSLLLQLNNARKIYQLSKYFGLMGIFNKCLYYNKYKKKFYFSLKFLEGINDEYFLFLKESKNNFVITNYDTEKVFIFNGQEHHLIIKDCLLCERKLDNMYTEQLQYYKIPEQLYKFILENNNMNDNKIIQNITKHINELNNLTEIIDRSISVDKSKSIKSYKSYKTKDTFSLKKYSQFVNINNKNNDNKNKNAPIKIVNFKEDKKGEKDPLDPNKKKNHSFKNVRIPFISKQK